jgi:hypothetical protein
LRSPCFAAAELKTLLAQADSFSLAIGHRVPGPTPVATAIFGRRRADPGPAPGSDDLMAKAGAVLRGAGSGRYPERPGPGPLAGH